MGDAFRRSVEEVLAAAEAKRNPRPRWTPDRSDVRDLRDPEFAVEGIDPKAPSEFVRDIPGFGLRYVNYAQIFRAYSTDPREALRRLMSDVEAAVNWGLQRLSTSPYYIARHTAGLEFLEAYVGAPIDPAYCRLAVLQPLSVTWNENDHRYDAILEAGLDIKPRRKWEKR